VALTPEFAFDSETFIDTECLDGALRIRMKCCPTVENRLRIEFHGETKTRGANDFVPASMVVVQREIPAYGLQEYNRVLRATNEGLKWADSTGYVASDIAPEDTSAIWVDLSDESDDGFQEAVNMALAQAKASGQFDGKIPVVGTDYFTAADKVEMVNAVIAALPVYAGEVI
jgi:hypothetical protein